MELHNFTAEPKQAIVFGRRLREIIGTLDEAKRDRKGYRGFAGETLAGHRASEGEGPYSAFPGPCGDKFGIGHGGLHFDDDVR